MSGDGGAAPPRGNGGLGKAREDLFEAIRLLVGRSVYRVGIRVSRLGGAICGPGREW